jgi:uncharacterized protein YjiS (DUF1127 family)
MAHAMTHKHGAGGLIARARKSLADRRRYRRTVEELKALSDRDLADLNIARFSIRDVARDSVYGA